MLARKVYDLMHKKGQGDEPRNLRDPPKRGVPSLQDIAKDVVAENFERYPHLKGLSEAVKKEVKGHLHP